MDSRNAVRAVRTNNGQIGHSDPALGTLLDQAQIGTCPRDLSPWRSVTASNGQPQRRSCCENQQWPDWPFGSCARYPPRSGSDRNMSARSFTVEVRNSFEWTAATPFVL